MNQGQCVNLRSVSEGGRATNPPPHRVTPESISRQAQCRDVSASAGRRTGKHFALAQITPTLSSMHNISHTAVPARDGKHLYSQELALGAAGSVNGLKVSRVEHLFLSQLLA